MISSTAIAMPRIARNITGQQCWGGHAGFLD
jgi:hypothetical protein